jgi:hypothetical protein
MNDMASHTFHPVEWNVATRRPIVDGKVTNAGTGEPQEAAGDMYSGPPSIDFIWHNMNTASNARTVRGPKHMTIDRLFVAVAKHIEQGLYKLISVNATEYAMVIVCSSEMSYEDFRAAWNAT